MEIGKCTINKKFGNSTVSIKAKPILFRDVFTFGVQESKFDKKKFTAALCLDEDQLARLEKVGEECLEGLKQKGIAATEVKSGLYNDKVYIKADPNLFSAFRENDEQVGFDELIKLTKYKVNAAIDVSGAFVKDGVAHLQLYFHELVILDEKEVKKLERERVVF